MSESFSRTPEERLAGRPDWLEVALDSGCIGLWRWDKVTGLIEWSPQIHALMGIPSGTFDGTYEMFSSFIFPDDASVLEAATQRAFDYPDEPYLVRHRIIRRSDREIRWLEGRGRVFKKGTIACGIVGTTMDVTDRVAAEHALDESRQKMQDLIDTVPAFIQQVDVQGRIVFANQTVDGIDRVAMPGSLAVDWVSSESRSEFRAALNRAMSMSVTVDLEYNGYGPGGLNAHYYSRIRGVWRGSVCEGAYLVTTDVTEHVAAQQALRASEARLRSAADSMPFAFWVQDELGRLVIQNKFSLANWGNQIGNRLSDMPIDPASRDQATKNIARAFAGEVVRQEVQIRTLQGPAVYESLMAPVLDGDRVIGVLGVDLDVTEQRNLEDHLHRTAREESVGRLAGGIAHDFNNLLTAILGYADLGLIAAEAGNAEKITTSLQRIIEAGRRGATLTGQMLSYARRQPAALQPRSPARLVERVIRLAQPILGEMIDVGLGLDAHVPAIYADDALLEQVLLNIVVNARDAMPDGGHLFVSTFLTELTPDQVVGQGEALPGSFVCFSIRDTGMGMPPNVQSRLFEPFFTTKPIGKGTGLGLASSQGIVRQHRGLIQVDSTPGQGTTFRMYIPIASEGKEQEESGKHLAIKGHGETILLVEDEALIRDMIASALEGLGYRILVAHDGLAALQLLDAYDGTVDAVVTDLVMPRMGGGVLADEVRKRFPNIRVIFASGYANDIARPVLGDRDVFLQKPFTTAVLAHCLHEMLLGGSKSD